MQTFDFRKEYILENETVELRPLEMSDYDILTPFVLEQPEIWDFSLQSADSLEDMEAYIRSALEGRKSRRSYPFVVFDKRSGQYAGCTRFYDFQEYHNTVQIGYTWYGKEFQGTGLNKQCKFLMLQFAFEDMGVERVEFRTDSENERGICSLKSIGCTLEGTLRNNCFAANGQRNTVVLSLLKDEWFNGAKGNLLAKIENQSTASRS